MSRNPQLANIQKPQPHQKNDVDELRRENELLRQMLTGDNELAFNTIETLKSQRDKAYEDIAALKSDLYALFPCQFATLKIDGGTRVGVTLLIERENGRITIHRDYGTLPETAEAIEARLRPQITAALHHTPQDIDIQGNPETSGLTRLQFIGECCIPLAVLRDVAPKKAYRRARKSVINALFNKMVEDGKFTREQRQDYTGYLGKQIDRTFAAMDARIATIKEQNAPMVEIRQNLSNSNER